MPPSGTPITLPPNWSEVDEFFPVCEYVADVGDAANLLI